MFYVPGYRTPLNALPCRVYLGVDADGVSRHGYPHDDVRPRRSLRHVGPHNHDHLHPAVRGDVVAMVMVSHRSWATQQDKGRGETVRHTTGARYCKDLQRAATERAFVRATHKTRETVTYATTTRTRTVELTKTWQDDLLS